MKEKGGRFTIAFYNVENLFDTINDPTINDEDFLPHGKNKWGTIRYNEKLNNLAKVISELGDSDGPEVLGLSEIENSRVLKDLLSHPKVNNRKYKFIHFESGDNRGIDVALAYKDSFFKPISSKTFAIPDTEEKNYKTRDILYSKGISLGDTIHLFVVHWPSRRAGKEQTEKDRLHVSKVMKHLIDSICKGPEKNILVMGDFNDTPSDKSIRNLTDKNNQCNLSNPFKGLHDEKLGTIKHKKVWELFDQILVSKGFSNQKGIEYKEASADIYDPIWLYYKEDERNGPFRSFIGPKYFGGYSDHFPVYIQIK